MNSKPAFQIVTLCCSIAMLGGYVVYAQRRAQPASMASNESSAGPLPSQAAELELPPTTRISAVAGGSKRGADVFAADIMTTVAPANGVQASPNPPAIAGLPMTQTIATRADGSTVTTRVGENAPPRIFAPSSKVMVGIIQPPGQQPGAGQSSLQLSSGTLVIPGTIHHGQAGQLITVLPPSIESGATQPIAIEAVKAPGLQAPQRQVFISSTKSAPVFVPPRTGTLAPVPASPATGAQPTAPITGVPTSGRPADRAPAAVPPTEPPRLPAPAPALNPAQKAQAPATLVVPEPARPRAIAPGSKSIDMLLFGRGTAQPAPKPAAPQQTAAQPQQAPKAP
jgi:hypothetical protein